MVIGYSRRERQISEKTPSSGEARGAVQQVGSHDGVERGHQSQAKRRTPGRETKNHSADTPVSRFGIVRAMAIKNPADIVIEAERPRGHYGDVHRRFVSKRF